MLQIVSMVLCVAALCQLTAFAEGVETKDAAAYLADALEYLDGYNITPVYGTDTNVCEVLDSHLDDGGYGDIESRIESVDTVYDGGNIDEDGNIQYFFAAPDQMRAVWFASFKVVFELNYENESVQYAPTKNIVVGWDEDRVQEYITLNAADTLLWEDISGENASAVTEDLVLPRYLDDRNVSVSWEVSPASSVSLKEPDFTDIDEFLYGPYKGVVRRAKDDTNVVLTAKMSLNKAEGIYVKKDFEITIPGTEKETLEDKAKRMLDELDFADFKRYDTLGGFDAQNAVSDILLPTPGGLGIENGEFKFELSVNNEADREYINVPNAINSSRIYVFRPLPGEGDKTVTFTVTLKASEYEDITASKDFEITVKELSQDELDRASEEIESVCNNFFEYIKGENTSENEVTSNLSSFYGLYKENGVFTPKDYTEKEYNNGIIAKIVNPYEPEDYRRRFLSSDNSVITDDILTVTRQSSDRNVTVEALLSNEVFDTYIYSTEYPLKYDFDYNGKYSKNQSIVSLCGQKAVVQLTVPAAPIEACITVSVVDENGIVRKGDVLLAYRPLVVDDKDSDNVITVSDMLACAAEELFGGDMTVLNSARIYKNSKSISESGEKIIDGDDVLVAVNGVQENSKKLYFDRQNIVVKTGSTIDIGVFDDDNNPVEGAKIKAYLPLQEKELAVTGADGKAEVVADSEDILYLAACADGYISATLSITVSDEIIPAESISLSETSKILSIGDTLRLNASILPENATNKNVIWKSSNTSVAEVNTNGVVKAVGSGRATISAVSEEIGGEGATCSITVKGNSVSDDGLFAVTFKLKIRDDVVLSRTVSGLSDGVSVYDVFKSVLIENGYTFTAPGGYVSSVTDPEGNCVSEFSDGPNSGWMYMVNGELPFDYMADYMLSRGDSIMILYVTDYNEFFEDTSSSGTGGSLQTPSSNNQDKTDNEETDKTEDEDKTDEKVYPGFIDVADDAWYYSSVKFAYENNIFEGVGKGKFEPESYLTRAMAVSVLYRIFGDGEYSYSGAFEDVDEESWYAEAVTWGAENGIVYGVEENRFAPDEMITREQFAVFLYRASGAKTEESQELAFSDKDEISEYAVDAVLWANGKGLIAGYTDGTVCPNGIITRAQAASILERYCLIK